MIRLLHFFMTVLVGTGLVHIAEIFLIPQVATQDAWARLSAKAEAGVFVPIMPGDGIAQSAQVFDRNFSTGACLFSLENGPVHIKGLRSPSFWSLSLFNNQGDNIYSVNDKTTITGALDVIVATPVQVIELQNQQADELSGSVIAEADIDSGFVVLRAFRDESSQTAEANKFIADSSCDAL